MYAAFVGMGQSTFSAAAVPGYSAVAPLGMAQGAGSVDLEAGLLLRSLEQYPVVLFTPISLFCVKIFYL